MKKRWRNVERNLPPKNKPVLIRACIKTVGEYLGDEVKEGEEEWKQSAEAMIIAKVTHWMPMNED